MQWNAAISRYDSAFRPRRRGMVPELMTRIYGSSDLFPDDLHESYRPFQSVNYVTSHDGFTLYDLVSFNQKTQLGQRARQHRWRMTISVGIAAGKATNKCPPKSCRLRKQQVKNFFCLLMLSNGTPMFRMGDEFLHTQRGNNNPYNQDNETTWLDWARPRRESRSFSVCPRHDRVSANHIPPSHVLSFGEMTFAGLAPTDLVDLSESSQIVSLLSSWTNHQRRRPLCHDQFQ